MTSAYDSVVYVSLPPDSIPGADTATISNLITGHAISVHVQGGGFDPVPLAATVGDSLEMRAYRGATVIAIAYSRVNFRRPPTLVRTDPPKGKTDVPLNTQIVIVFSEPIDSATLAGAIHLASANAGVAGTLTLSSSGIIAHFVPDSVLVPQTAYELMVDTVVRNRAGSALDSVVHVSFTTAATTPPPIDSTPRTQSLRLAFISQTTLMSQGFPALRLPLQVAIQDSNGNTVSSATNAITLAEGGTALQWESTAWFPIGQVQLYGTTTRNAVKGIAAFDDIDIGWNGSGFTLTATASGIACATSLPFNIGVAFDTVPPNPPLASPVGNFWLDSYAGHPYYVPWTQSNGLFWLEDGDATLKADSTYTLSRELRIGPADCSTGNGLFTVYYTGTWTASGDSIVFHEQTHQRLYSGRYANDTLTISINDTSYVYVANPTGASARRVPYRSGASRSVLRPSTRP